MKGVLHGFTYPIYAVDIVGRNAVVVAGGGGAVKTGVPNRIDVVHLDKSGGSPVSPHGITDCSVSASIGGGVDTGIEAVMNLTVANSGEGSFITSLEGRQCIEYLARLKATKEQCKVVANTTTHSKMQSKADHKEASSGASAVRRRGRNQNSVKSITKKSEPGTNSSTTNTSAQPQQHSKESREWELTKLRSFTLPFPLPDSPDVNGVQVKASDGSGLPTCVATGGPGGCWLAVGSDVGSVFLINRHVDPERNIVEPASRSHQLKVYTELEMVHWLRREVTDRKNCGSNPTSASRMLLSRLWHPGSISALVLTSGRMAGRHRKGATAEPFTFSTIYYHRFFLCISFGIANFLTGRSVVRTRPQPLDFPCLGLGNLAVSQPSCFLRVAARPRKGFTAERFVYVYCFILKSRYEVHASITIRLLNVIFKLLNESNLMMMKR
ncbi:hypothetical protein CSKR_114367 [Clonorchis sinensis]|uniref:Prolactin regulatory element-binding protein n=1 Tax=Clonorchis sinensis TaxID=79923 RepID=A0A8T1MDQ4_CLOSI|nr:hypothetical protein CSKR_114367 [Clonorchis sinensis]